MTLSPRPARRVLRFPLWAKLLLGVLLAALVPLVIVVVVLLSGTQVISQETARAYVTQTGARQREVLTGTFDRARERLRDFRDNPTYNRQLLALLLGDRRTTPPLPQTTPADIQQLFETTLLNPSRTNFASVRLLDGNGTLVVSAGGAFVGVPGLDERNSDAFRAVRGTQRSGLGTPPVGGPPPTDQATVVSQRGTAIIEMVDTLYLPDSRTPIGYLIAILDNDLAVLNNLDFTENQFGTTSYLVGTNNVLLARPEVLPNVRATLNLGIVERARTGSSNTELTDSTTTDELFVYYTPLANTPFVLVTQLPTNVGLTTYLGTLGSGAFALTLGTLALGVLAAVAAFGRVITAPVRRVQQAVQAVAVGNFDEPLADVDRQDEVGDLARAVGDMRLQLRDLITDLEARIETRTRDVRATQEISRFSVSQRDLTTLMDSVVNLIVERFPNIYHAQIFLVDADRRFAVLRASTGQAGRELLLRGHRLAVGSVSVIGQVTAQGQVIVARDTAVSEVHRANEFLPDTQAEVAVPLRVGATVIGALDVQSRERATFTEDQLAVLQTMADQLAIAIENVRLYQESVQRLAEIDQANRQNTLRVWREYMYDQRQPELVSEAGTRTALDVSALRRQAISTGQTAVGDVTERQTIPIAVPVRLRGQTLGAVEWELPAADFGPLKLQLAQTLADRLALSLDNARLFEQSQRATERERLVNDIAAKLTVQTDINQILKTAVREVGQALRAPQVSIHLAPSVRRPEE